MTNHKRSLTITNVPLSPPDKKTESIRQHHPKLPFPARMQNTTFALALERTSVMLRRTDHGQTDATPNSSCCDGIEHLKRERHGCRSRINGAPFGLYQTAVSLYDNSPLP